MITATTLTKTFDGFAALNEFTAEIPAAPSTVWWGPMARENPPCFG